MFFQGKVKWLTLWREWFTLRRMFWIQQERSEVVMIPESSAHYFDVMVWSGMGKIEVFTKLWDKRTVETRKQWNHLLVKLKLPLEQQSINNSPTGSCYKIQLNPCNVLVYSDIWYYSYTRNLSVATIQVIRYELIARNHLLIFLFLRKF